MSREVIFHLLHPEVIKILEKMGQSSLAVEVERAGERHDVYDFLDKSFSMYYAEYGGVNCRWLRDAIQRDWEKVTNVLLPRLLSQYVALKTGAKGTEKPKQQLGHLLQYGA